MRIDIVQIGNSKGIRIPKSVLEACHFKDALDLEVEDGIVILRNLKRKPRQGWGVAFRKMAHAGDDRLMDPEIRTNWDESEWQW